MTYIWDQLFVAFEASRWADGTWDCVRSHEFRMSFISTALLCCFSPNHNRCYWVHISKYLPWWGAYETEGGAQSMATLTEQQILASELARCFQSQRSCWKRTVVMQHGPIFVEKARRKSKPKLWEAAIRAGFRTGRTCSELKPTAGGD